MGNANKSANAQEENARQHPRGVTPDHTPKYHQAPGGTNSTVDQTTQHHGETHQASKSWQCGYAKAIHAYPRP